MESTSDIPFDEFAERSSSNINLISAVVQEVMKAFREKQGNGGLTIENPT